MAWPNPYINDWSIGNFSTSRTNVSLAGTTTIASNYKREGLYSCRVFADNSTQDDGVHRTQRVWGSTYSEYHILTGYEHWFGFSCRVNSGEWPSGWTHDNGRAILWQINQGPGGPEIHLQGDATDGRFDWIGDAPNLPRNVNWPRDQWVDFVVNIVRSYNGNGKTRIWQDGSLIYNQSNITNAHSNATTPIVTYGIYWGEDNRPGWESTIYWDSFRLYRGAIGVDYFDEVNPASSSTKNSVYPDSTYITGINFNMNTLQNYAPGSDNWPVTWADDGHQYTSWGDGGGFGGTNSDGRVSLGVGRVQGNKDSYTGYNVWGGKNPENPATFTGKSIGIICISGVLYLFRNGNASTTSAHDFTELYSSTDHGANWSYRFRWQNNTDFSGWLGFFAPSFIQFGQNYSGARDSYVYAVAAELVEDAWTIQTPGRIHLLRAPIASIGSKSSWQYFSGTSSNPSWTNNINNSQPMFIDNINGVHHISASYNDYLDRYILCSVQAGLSQPDGSLVGFYEAPEPWGPWRTIDFLDTWNIGLKATDEDPGEDPFNLFFNFSNKWTVERGTNNFVLVYTGDGNDEWGSVEGSFDVESAPPPPPPPPTDITMVHSNPCNNYTSGLWPQPLTENFSWCNDVYTITSDPLNASNTVFKLTADGTQQGCDYEEDRDLYKQRAQVLTIDPDSGATSGWGNCLIIEEGFTWWWGYRYFIPTYTQGYWEQFASNSDRNMAHISFRTGADCTMHLRATSAPNAIQMRANVAANRTTAVSDTFTINNAFGRWINVVVRHKVSSSADGSLIVWIDGVERSRREGYITHSSGVDGMTKVGLYMSNGDERPWKFELLLDNYRLARSSDSILDSVGFDFVNPATGSSGILIAEANGPYSADVDEDIQFSSAGSIDQS